MNNIMDGRRPPFRPIRSLLFAPGLLDKRVEECVDDVRASGADGVIYDLEDPPRPYPFSEPERAATLAWVREQLDPTPHAAATSRDHKAGTEQGSCSRLWVRVRSVETHRTLHDLSAVVGPGLEGIVLPKPSGPSDVAIVDAILSALEVERGLPLGSVALIPLIESPDNVRSAYEIAAAAQRVVSIGGFASRYGDVARSIGLTWTAAGTETLYLRSKVLIDARAAGLRFPIGGMWAGDPSDLEQLREFAEETRRLGYYGMMLSNPAPDHVAVVNDVFTPKRSQVDAWLEIEAAHACGDNTLYTDKAVANAADGLEWARGLGLAEPSP